MKLSMRFNVARAMRIYSEIDRDVWHPLILSLWRQGISVRYWVCFTQDND